ncbi:hypothetical protein C0993_000775 [Termitomyces sp. T159_Od127]|nr:hypothetical protein C0993_000775 [Termitomyces sp. T159_Od127]
MSQLANPDTPPDAPAPQDEAWTCLLHLKMQVQLTQAFLTHHTTELSTLCQTTNHISQSLQALLELAALAGLCVQIPHLVLPDTYDGNRTSREHFFPCLTYIHLSGDAFDSDALKIAWVLSYMKAGEASTYALHVLQCSGGVGSFIDWAAFEKDFQAEFFPIDPAKSTALGLHNREQYGQRKQTLDEYIDSFQALVEQAACPDGLQLCLMFWNGLHPALMECIDNLAEGHPNNEQIASWYKVAQNQWQLMEIQWELYQTHPAHHPTPMVSL